MKKLQKRKNGFTLIEVIVATTLIATLAVGILPLFINSIIVNAEVKKKQMALKFAENKAEAYRIKEYTEIVDLQPYPESDPAEIFYISLLPDGNGKVYITDYDGNPDIKEIRVNINWRGHKSVTDNIDLYILVHQYGLNS